MDPWTSHSIKLTTLATFFNIDNRSIALPCKDIAMSLKNPSLLGITLKKSMNAKLRDPKLGEVNAKKFKLQISSFFSVVFMNFERFYGFFLYIALCPLIEKAR
jgi:hypothetical protein